MHRQDHLVWQKQKQLKNKHDPSKKIEYPFEIYEYIYVISYS